MIMIVLVLIIITYMMITTAILSEQHELILQRLDIIEMTKDKDTYNIYPNDESIIIPKEKKYY